MNINTYQEIVQDLSKKEPHYFIDEGYPYCGICDNELFNDNIENHDETCEYRRAKEISNNKEITPKRLEELGFYPTPVTELTWQSKIYNNENIEIVFTRNKEFIGKEGKVIKIQLKKYNSDFCCIEWKSLNIENMQELINYMKCHNLIHR